MIERILAKSTGQTLPDHTAAVMEAGQAILDEQGDTILRQLALRGWDAAVRSALKRAVALHDLGKATVPFQEMLRGRLAPDRLPLSHELVSVWLALRDGLASWLFSGTPPVIRTAVIAAVAGHHLRLEQINVSVRPGFGPRLPVLCDHPDVTATLGLLVGELGQPPALTPHALELTSPGVDGLTGELLRAQSAWRRLSKAERRVVALVKALLVASDVQGSARHHGVAEYVRSRLRRTLLADELDRVVRRALSRDGKPATPLRFQKSVAATSARVTLLEAGCGSGKTAAAYLWARPRAVGRRLFFCYPTTGTATEGFRTVLHHAFSPEEDPGLLLHSRADVDLVELELSPDLDPLEVLDRYQSLDIWYRPLVVCTVDQVLGLMQNYRRALYASPLLATAAFVFDEVHLYDTRMFGALVRFLGAFEGAPVLLMTATLQPERGNALMSALRGALARIGGPPDLEKIPRYVLRRGDEQEAWNAVRDAVSEGEHVLWVCNTVDRAVDTARRAAQNMSGCPIFLYHSRYRYKDCGNRRQSLLHAFRQPVPALAVTTQVCEVSFNLSAGLLVTESCPVTSLIQRLGRLNRWARPGDPPKPALVIDPPSAQPYEAHDLRVADRWLAVHLDRPVSQRDLSVSIPDDAWDGPEESEWLDGGICTGSAPLREPGLTVEVVREEDIEQEWLDRPKHLDRRALLALHEAIIPMLYPPVRDELPTWRTCRGIVVAPRGRILYDEWSGARWAIP